jgi:hypothetical protein
MSEGEFQASSAFLVCSLNQGGGSSETPHHTVEDLTSQSNTRGINRLAAAAAAAVPDMIFLWWLRTSCVCAPQYQAGQVNEQQWQDILTAAAVNLPHQLLLCCCKLLLLPLSWLVEALWPLMVSWLRHVWCEAHTLRGTLLLNCTCTSSSGSLPLLAYSSNLSRKQ